MKIFTSDLSTLNNQNKYSLFYSQACHSGQVEKSDCIAEEWVISEKTGGFAAIMNTGVGYGSATSYDGTDNRYAREFFDALFSSQEKISEIGKANQDSKQDNYYRIDESGMHMYHVYYNTLLFGDPYVKIKGSEGTIAEFIWNPEYPKTGETIIFNDKSTGNIIYREWNFGDGGHSQEKNVSHSYYAEDIYSVTLNIWDDEGYMSSVTHDIEVRNHWSPIPVIYYGYNGENEFTMDFNGNDSWDPDGTIISYEWDFDDGTTSNEINPTHEFSFEGEYNVRLMVVDNEDNIGMGFSEIIIVRQQPPVKPSILSGTTNGIAESEYAFTTGTIDPEDNIIKYGWDWGDDTPIEWSKYYASGEHCLMTHIWNSSGSYNVRVIAKDLPGVESEWSDVLIVEMIENEAPIVEIIKPTRGLYLNNNKMLPFFISIIIGDIDVEVTALDGGGIDRVEFYIDDLLMEELTYEPYIWAWNDNNIPGIRHNIKVMAYDNSGKQSSSEINVWRIFSGILWKQPI
jgi:PKD repeat protein